MEFQVVENRPSRTQRRAKHKIKKVGKANHKLRSLKYWFASDQNAIQALESAMSFELKIILQAKFC